MLFWRIFFAMATATWTAMAVTSGENHAYVMAAIFAVGYATQDALRPAQGMVPREDSRSEAEGVAHQPGPATQDAPNLNPDTSDRLGEG